jgi:transposase-like protein
MNKEAILQNSLEQQQLKDIQNKIVEDIYTDKDLISLLDLLKENTDKMDYLQTRKLCELVQYLYTNEREERHPNKLLDIINGMFYKH